MKIPAPSESDINAALWDEVKAGYAAEQATEKVRLDDLRDVTTEAKRAGNKTIPGLGKLVAMLPLEEYLRLTHKYGTAEIQSKEFIRYIHRKVPETKVANI